LITNIPKPEDFTNVAKQCLIQSFNIIYNEDVHFNYEYGPPRDDFWKYHLALLNTSVILIYQAIESLLKAKVCEESALLLLDMKRENWPTGPNSEDKDFNDLFTIGGESLLNTYLATVEKKDIEPSLAVFIEEIRITRNRIMHGVVHKTLTPEFIIKSILQTFNFFLGQDSWRNTTRDLLINNPIFGIYNEDYEEALFIEKLDYSENLVGKGFLNQQFSIDIKSRRYFCPWCFQSLGQKGYDLYSLWAFLIPQKEENTEEIICLNCQRTNKVERVNCIKKDCKGNVINENNRDEKICLTCNSEQY
jgi:hypothetical protein